MPNDCIMYQNSGYFSKLIIDYLDEKPEIKSLYNHFPHIENFKNQIENKIKSGINNRSQLVLELEIQYAEFDISELTKSNIQLLKETNTFTITTGHQLNLFTGPLYFIYKIISTINLCKKLKQKYPEYNFVPIYWMATEDHDFDEINYFNFKDKVFRWHRESFGPVGRLSTEGLDKVFDLFSKEIGASNNANFLKNIFQKSYLEHSNLADATRFLANELFKNEGLVIIDGDSKSLKKLFIPQIKKELLEGISFKKINETITSLSNYDIQVKPREINMFYIENGLRERIILENNTYKVMNTKYSFSESEIINEVENHPEKFSPNVVLRPLYQEVILPNLCYIGGGGEIAYWLELKSSFEAFNVCFPILLLRNSVLLTTEKQNKKIDKLELNWNDLFKNQSELINQKTKEFSIFTIDFTKQKEYLKNQFEDLYKIAIQTDKSFFGAVKAQEVKQLKGLENLEKRLLKAEKRNNAAILERIIHIQNELFPGQSLQERKLNFSTFYLEFGSKLIEELLKELNPLSEEFRIITL